MNVAKKCEKSYKKLKKATKNKKKIDKATTGIHTASGLKQVY